MKEKVARIVRHRATVMLVLFMISVMSSGFGPLELREQGKSLASVSAVKVAVNIGISREGPAKHLLQEAVETKLREESIKLWEETPDILQHPPPSLFIEVAVWKMSSRPFVYFVHADFYQPVLLVGNENVSTQAVTWQTGLIGEGNLDRIRRDVEKITGVFIGHYKKNRKEKPS